MPQSLHQLRVVPDAVLLFASCRARLHLTGVPPERDAVLLQIPCEQGCHAVVQLVVCQGIHRIHKQRSNPGLPWLGVSQEVVRYRIEKSLSLAAARPGRRQEALLVDDGATQRLFLMAMELSVRGRELSHRVVDEAARRLQQPR